VAGNQYFGSAPSGPYTTPEGIVQQGVTEVDVETLASAVAWLDGLKSYIQTHLIPDCSRMTITKDDTDLWFGGLDSAGQVATLHTTYVNSAIDSYRSIQHSLDVAARATSDIVKNYKDVEQNNTVTAQNIDSSFASASGGSGSSIPAQSASSTTSPTTTSTTTTTTGGDQATHGRFQ
jgi:hypothetical protein